MISDIFRRLNMVMRGIGRVLMWVVHQPQVLDPSGFSCPKERLSPEEEKGERRKRGQKKEEKKGKVEFNCAAS